MSDTRTPPADQTQDKAENAKKKRAATEEKIEEGLEETFPASDPPAIGGSTGERDC
ncbi:hypothetical protein HLH34_08840 [Gluconacetobacter azotocaptans]|uniref:Uncharacterized protein n=1 Tax=Gluconacetobacter azotocaptans TaxID=142834 RepID=A0A7W4JSH8_9PROT|nr:hypothetical protein [Gluconacetobacter azotocaptans]MBB2190074.1 hypothetical protein [Gluconacetobacter azotocaptans]MBM9402802.1 hypothetical protein [Gluconacetobacter azotocaptans]GBQ26081.1 hypothetical protein AA13594_0127 [Gluconacetobacter azotocaptans DSM 13594]